MNSRIILADDHVMVRQGLKTLLESEPGLDVVAEAESGVELVAQVNKHQPDLVIADIAMPYGNGLEIVGEVRRWSPATKIMLLTGLTSNSLLSQAVSTGVEGVFLKSDAPDVFVAGVRKVLGGAISISPHALRLSSGSTAFNSLSPRELQVLFGIARGDTNALLGERLGISAKTVDKHRSSLMRKLGVNSMAQLLSLSVREGLLDTAKSV